LSISLYEVSVGVYLPFLNNLKGLLDCASEHSVAKNIDPITLLALRLAPNIYSFSQQVDEARGDDMGSYRLKTIFDLDQAYFQPGSSPARTKNGMIHNLGAHFPQETSSGEAGSSLRRG
jgi:Domain of unknown function (DUF1993)